MFRLTLQFSQCIGHHSYYPKGPFYEIKKKLFFENAKVMKPLNGNGEVIREKSLMSREVK